MAAEIKVVSASRPRPGETVNGDAWTHQWVDGKLRVTLVDALGHGPEAAAIAEQAIALAESRPELPPTRLIETCHDVLRNTRGAAVAVGLIDPAAGLLTYAGIGNLEARMVRSNSEERLISYRGIVGSAMRTIRAFELSLTSPWMLILHSDGVSSRAELPSDALDQDPESLAQALLDIHARESDDATVVIVRS